MRLVKQLNLKKQTVGNILPLTELRTKMFLLRKPERGAFQRIILSGDAIQLKAPTDPAWFFQT